MWNINWSEEQLKETFTRRIFVTWVCISGCDLRKSFMGSVRIKDGVRLTIVRMVIAKKPFLAAKSETARGVSAEIPLK